MPGFVRRLPDRLLTVGALIGALALVATMLGLALGVRPIFLRSGSMAPTLTTGTLVLARQVSAADLTVGDVVCVRSEGGPRVTHRIVGIDREGAEAVLTLKGDANSGVDPERYRVTSTYRVIGHVPLLGYLIGAAFTPVGLFVLGGFVMSLLLLIVRGDRDRDRDSGPGAGPRSGSRSGSPQHRRAERSVRRPAVVATGVVLAVLGPGQTQGAWAAWTNDVVISGTTLTVGTIPAPATFTCGSLGVLSVTFNWASVAGATDYTLHYGSGGSSTVAVAGTSKTIVNAISGGTAWVQANRNFGSTTWTSAASNTRTYTVAVVSLCS